MRAPIVGLHLAIVGLLGLLGLYFVSDPCLGGGDLCLGGVVGLMALGVAAFGLLGLGLWQLSRRAAMLLILDSVLVAALGPLALGSMAYGPASLIVLGTLGVVALAVVGVVFAASHVATHRIESIVVLAALGLLALNRDAGGPGAPVVGAIALAIGWLVARRSIQPHGAVPAPTSTDSPA